MSFGILLERRLPQIEKKVKAAGQQRAKKRITCKMTPKYTHDIAFILISLIN